MMVCTHLVSSAASSQKVIHELLTGTSTVFSVAFKYGLTGKPDVVLAMVGTVGGDVYVFDLKVKPYLMHDGQLWRLLATTEVTKVMHDCRQACVSMRRQFNVEMKNIFDTQACYCLMLMHENFPPRNINLHHLYDKFGDPGQRLLGDLETGVEGSGMFWTQRPLSREMIHSAANDVLVLLPAVFENMKSEMAMRGIEESELDVLCQAYMNGKVKMLSEEVPVQKHKKKRAIIKLNDQQRHLLACSRPAGTASQPL